MKKWFALLFTFVLFSPIAVADPPNTDSVMIPLEEVWAFRMLGTIDISKAIPISHAITIDEIRRSLSQLPPKDSEAKPAFAVTGQGVEALVGAKEALVGGNAPKQSFRAHDDISVVFFSRLCPWFVHLDSIEKSGNIIQVAYRFVPHEESNLTEHFALIPIGKLPPGKYEVKIVPIPMDTTLLKKGFRPPGSDVAASTVCRSSEFDVTE